MDVRYFGNGGTALVIGEGNPRQVDDGRGNLTEVATTRVLVLDPSWIEEVEADQLSDERPELHPDTGRPLSETAPGAQSVGRGGPSYDELAAEVARLRAESPGYDPTQDFGNSTQVAASQQPGGSAPLVTTTEATPGTVAAPGHDAITEAPAPEIREAAADPDPQATPDGYAQNADGTYTRLADGVRGTIDWNAKTFHPQA